MALQIRRGPTTDRTSVAFQQGEIVFDTTLNEVFIGDGSTLGGRPVTAYTNENAIDAVGAALVAGTHQNIAFTYGSTQDGANRIDATVTLDGIGLLNVVEDTTPQLGGNLDLNSHNVTGTGDINITGTITATTFSGVTKAMVGLSNVTNESKATMFTDPTFTGTVAGVTKAMVGLSNVTNESKATMFTSPTFTGTTALDVVNITGLTNITSLANAPTLITVDDALTTTSQSPALQLKVLAGLIDNSGPALDFSVDSSTESEAKLSRVLATSTADGPSLKLSLWNGSSYATYVEALNNAVILNDTLVIKQNGLFNHADVAPSVTPGTDITVYSEGDIVTYGTVKPGIENSVTSGTFDLGADTARYKDLYLTHGFILTGYTPASSKGQAGDKAGQVTVDDNYVYRCVADYTDGVADIWKRVGLVGGTW